MIYHIKHIKEYAWKSPAIFVIKYFHNFICVLWFSCCLLIFVVCVVILMAPTTIMISLATWQSKPLILLVVTLICSCWSSVKSASVWHFRYGTKVKLSLLICPQCFYCISSSKLWILACRTLSFLFQELVFYHILYRFFSEFQTILSI